jgi:rubrerythrin
MEYWFSAHETAKLAAEMESKGAAFYTQLQRLTTDATVAEMCAVLAGQEREHRAKFLAIADFHRTSDSELCYAVDVRGMLGAAMRSLARLLEAATPAAALPASVAECLALAENVEVTSVSVYAHMLKVFTSRFAAILSDVLAEEQQHLRMVRNVRDRLNPPADGTPPAP